MDELMRLYEEMIEIVNENNIRTEDNKLTALFHMKGNLFKGDVMVDSVGKYTFNDNTYSKLIIAKHPQGKDENMMVDEILKYYM